MIINNLNEQIQKLAEDIYKSKELENYIILNNKTGLLYVTDFNDCKQCCQIQKSHTGICLIINTGQNEYVIKKDLRNKINKFLNNNKVVI